MCLLKIPELLAPAGNMEKAKIAIAYGADAIYLSGLEYGMRAAAGNFSNDDLAAVISYAHQRGVKVYVTVNIYPHNMHLEGLPDYFRFLSDIQADAVIVADPGVIRIAKQTVPQLKLHLSTQANTVNWQSALFWSEMGLERLVMGREITKDDIALIRSKINTEIEVFVHGSMCVAYSGRCLLSSVMTGREANLGACTQCCRWKYSVMEESRPGEYFPIEETDEGTYIFNSKDLCLLAYLPDLVSIGVDSLKVEGRMKSVFYVGTTIRAYRLALDRFRADPQEYKPDPELMAEVKKVSHRPYYPGFFIGSDPSIHYTSSAYYQNYSFLGLIEDYDHNRGEAIVEVRNQLLRGQHVEIVQPNDRIIEFDVEQIINMRDGQQLDSAHANYHVRIKMPPVKRLAMLRCKVGEDSIKHR